MPRSKRRMAWMATGMDAEASVKVEVGQSVEVEDWAARCVEVVRLAAIKAVQETRRQGLATMKMRSEVAIHRRRYQAIQGATA